MNYIKKLQAEIEDTRELHRVQRETADEYLRYLLSDKFHEDTTIQVREVINMILQLRMDS